MTKIFNLKRRENLTFSYKTKAKFTKMQQIVEEQASTSKQKVKQGTKRVLEEDQENEELNGPMPILRLEVFDF